MSSVIGRVLDSFSAGATWCLVIDADGRRVQTDSKAPVPTGALVRLSTATDGGVQLIEVQCLPDKWDPAGDATRWLERRARLWSRHRIARSVRRWFDDSDFLEAETPLLVSGMAPDPHLSPIVADGGYLVTSTEYQVKRLFVGGFPRVFTLTKNFRSGELGPWHNPEFTMLEWGRIGASMTDIEADAQSVVQAAFCTANPDSRSLSYAGVEVDILAPEWEHLTLLDAFKRYLGIDLSAEFAIAEIRDALSRAALPGLPLPANKFEAVSLLVDAIQPQLGSPRPTFLSGWPLFLTPSAAAKPGAPEIADRSELFIAGVEVADGFAFARDANAQRTRFKDALTARNELGMAPVTTDEKYLLALESGLPAGAGMALGFDRLVMLLTGAREIQDVLTFSWNER